jgi:copper chaperone NosL
MKLSMASVMLAVTLLAGCKPPAEAPRNALQIKPDTHCALDGMLIADFPGPRAQIHYGVGAPEFFCDTAEMFSLYLAPKQSRPIIALYVQDMGATDWEHPRDQWIDARRAFYVRGSRRHGAMGPTLASFSAPEVAHAFAREYGGAVLQFEQVTADMAELHGSALHDQKM